MASSICGGGCPMWTSRRSEQYLSHERENKLSKVWLKIARPSRLSRLKPAMWNEQIISGLCGFSSPFWLFCRTPREIYDDLNRSREILTNIFGSLSFGQLGLDGFFLISGYLITKSFENSPSIGEYFFKTSLGSLPRIRGRISGLYTRYRTICGWRYCNFIRQKNMTHYVAVA